jgi:TolB-like protein/tetratricopeptide (TPR) repeat protein
MTTLNEGPSKLQRFIAEMRRRHVVRFTIWYGAAAFAVLQLAEIVFAAFGVGEVWLRIMVIGVVLAFPPLVVLTWIFDVTAEGIKRTEDPPSDRRVGALLPRLTLLGVTFILVGGLALWLGGAMGSKELGQTDSVAREAASSNAAGGGAIRSLAVLPLDNLSADTTQNYFTEGMHEALISELGQIPGIRVVSRTSVMQYAGTTKPTPVIGKELGVDAIIEGSVQKAGDEVRISVQLVKAANDSSIWSHRYDRKLEDVLSLQSEVAHQIVRTLRGEINPEDDAALHDDSSRRVAPGAQDDYLRGKYAYERGTPQGYRTALGHFQDAVRADSTFAPAYAGLAGSHFLIGMEGSSPDTAALREAQQEAEHAVTLDSQSVEAREVLSYIRRGIQAMAAAKTRTAIPTPPTPAVTTGGAKRVIRIPGVRDSVVVDVQPFDTAWVGALTQLGQGIANEVRRNTYGGSSSGGLAWMPAAWQLMSTGQFNDAAEVLRQTVSTSPHNPLAWDMLVRAVVSAGQTDTIVSAIERWSRSGAPGAPDTLSASVLRAAVAKRGMKGYWAWALSRLEERERSGHDVTRVDLAAAYAGMGNNNQALALLSQAFERGERGLLSLQFDPVWDGLRADPRFIELAREARELRYAPATRGSRGGRR